MEWKDVQRRGKKGAKNAAAAAEFLRALFHGAAQNKGGESKGGRADQTRRGPQWHCKACKGTANDLSRKKCRFCGTAQPTQKENVQQRAPGNGALGESPAPVAPREWPARPPPPEKREEAAAAKTVALEAAVAGLRAAGLDEEAALLNKANERMQKEGKRNAPANRPGARLDSCEAYVARARRRAQEAAAAVLAAEEALAAAKAHQVEFDAELAEGEARLESLRAGFAATEEDGELGADATCGNLLSSTKQLLQRLETGSFASTANMPADVISAMTAVHEALTAVSPPPPAPKLDAALEPQATTEAAGATRRKADALEHVEEEEQLSEDETMEELAALDDEDEEGLLQLARRLKQIKRARR